MFGHHMPNKTKLTQEYFDGVSYAPNFEKVGDILVSACPYVCKYVFMFEISS